MKSPAAILSLFVLLHTVSASVLSTTNIATVLAGATDQAALTVPADAFAAIQKLGTGGVSANKLSAADIAALAKCMTDGRNNNEASKAGIGGGTGSAGNIVFVAAKTTLHACESAQQQIGLSKGKASSDTSIKLLISNVGVLNANTKAAGLGKERRAVDFSA